MTFDSFDLGPKLLAGVRDLGFSEPTDIQRDAIPWALEGRDVLACAMTGSGKTAAFALPIMQRILDREGDDKANRALVLSPTRELATQTERHFQDLGKHTDVRVISIFGGVGYEPQERAFRQGVEVLVATPGRLLDHLRRPYASLDGLEFLVLDEADRMLDMGFIPDVRRILSFLPTDRQTMLFSATLDKQILRLAGDMLRDPVTINLERRAAPAEGVRQVAYPVRHELKPALLAHLLERHDVDSALVFTRTKERADLVGGYLKRSGVKVAVIHGDRTQKHRTRAMDEFKKGKYKVLVATDVAARGIDVVDLSHVINLDVPNMPDDYIHRVGRTARAGSTGDAMTFVAARELADLHLIEKAIGRKLERVRLDDFDYSPSAAAQASAQAARLAAQAPVLDAADDEEEEKGAVAEGAVEEEAAGSVAEDEADDAAEPQDEAADEAEATAPDDDEDDDFDDDDEEEDDDEEDDDDFDEDDDDEEDDDEEDEDDDEEPDDFVDDEEDEPRRPQPRGRSDRGVMERFAELRARRTGRKRKRGRSGGGGGGRARAKPEPKPKPERKPKRAPKPKRKPEPKPEPEPKREPKPEREPEKKEKGSSSVAERFARLRERRKR